jgi:hypothetical protein
LPAAHAQADTPGPFVTFLFSRTEQVPAMNCVADTTGTAPLSTVVEPYMASLGLTGTGTVNALATGATDYCTHNEGGQGTGESLASSWPELQALTADGWTFGAHEYDSAATLATLTPAQQWDITCGQAVTMQAQGLGPSDGMIAYPGAQKLSPAIVSLQENYGENCFGWGRTYDPTGITDQSAGTTAPYWQKTMVLKGGPGTGSAAYASPQQAVTAMSQLQPGQWLTIQVYLLVTETNPAGDTMTWSCDQPGVPNASNDVERYCWSDFQQVLAAAAAMQQAGQITVTDPLTVACQFGRPGPFGMTRPAN